jgi:hypothetical protein
MGDELDLTPLIIMPPDVNAIWRRQENGGPGVAGFRRKRNARHICFVGSIWNEG